MTLSIEPLEWWHARRFGVARLPGDVVGWTAFEDGRVIALGGAFAQDDGGGAEDVWLFLAGPARPVFHRYALLLIADLATEGVTRLKARPDAAIARSEFWLGRLGFRASEGGVWIREHAGECGRLCEPRPAGDLGDHVGRDGGGAVGARR